MYTRATERALDYLRTRNDYFYLLRVYKNRPPFVSARYMSVAMRAILGFFELSSAVLHAVVKNDGDVFYLEILCASPAASAFFSAVVRRSVPSAVVESLEAGDAVAFVERSRRSAAAPCIPNVGMLRSVRRPKTALLGLLLEYRAFEVSVRGVSSSGSTVAAANPGANPCVRSGAYGAARCNATAFVFFEKDGRLCGIPAFQVSGFGDENEKNGGDAPRDGKRNRALYCETQAGAVKTIPCEGVLFVEEVDVFSCSVVEKISGGLFRASADTLSHREGRRRRIDFVLVVPDFLPDSVGRV